LEMVESALERRVGKGIMTGVTSDQSAAVGRLFHGQVATRMTSITHELSGAAGAAWEDADGYTAETGDDFLMRQVTTIGGGTTEMARNVISERVLGMPRERTFDKDTPYRDVPKGPSNK